MSQTELRILTRPSETELVNAIANFDGSPDPDPRQLMEASLVIVSEACFQMGDEGKSPDDIVASLTTRGLVPGGARTFVDKAAEIVASAKSETASAQSELRAYYRELAILGVIVILVVAAILRN